MGPKGRTSYARIDRTGGVIAGDRVGIARARCAGARGATVLVFRIMSPRPRILDHQGLRVAVASA